MSDEIEVAAKLPPMPVEIAKAVIAVKRQIERIGKDETNAFAKFKYASVDQFYEAVGPLMAQAGLFDLVQEVDLNVEMREVQQENGAIKKSLWLTANYEIWMYHESGCQFGPIPRKIIVPATGPQAFGSGQSYVEKYFLRALFKIPTGEADADAERQEGIPARPQRENAKPWAAWLEAMYTALEKIETIERLDAVLAKNRQPIDDLRKASFNEGQALLTKIDTVRKALTPEEVTFEWVELDGTITEMSNGEYSALMLSEIEKAAPDRMEIIWENNSGQIAKLPEAMALKIRDAMDARAQAEEKTKRGTSTTKPTVTQPLTITLAYGPVIDLSTPTEIPVPAKSKFTEKGGQTKAWTAAIILIAEQAPAEKLIDWYNMNKGTVDNVKKINADIGASIDAAFNARYEAQAKAETELA